MMETLAPTNSQLARDDFMHLMLAQVQHQDPLEPLPQHEFLAQLAQFSTLEGIEQLNSSFENMLHFQEDLARLDQLIQGSTLVGQGVTYHIATASEGSELPSVQTVHGVIDSVRVEDGTLRLQVGEDSISINQVLSLGGPATEL